MLHRAYRHVLAGLLALVSFGGLASAEAPYVRELRLGVLAHDVPGIWSGFRLETTTPDLNGEVVLRPALPLFGGAVRPVIGGTVNFAGGTSKGYLDARWEYETKGGLWFGLGLGIAAHNGWNDATSVDHKALGSRVLLHFPFEIGYRFDPHHSLSIYFEHYSNGYSHKYNEGIDGIGLRYGYRF